MIQVTEYEKRLRRMQHVPQLSYGRVMLRDDGDLNRFFPTPQDSVGDVKGGMLGPGVISLRPSRTDQGSSRVISLSTSTYNTDFG
jgi:hypothetical protein